MRISQRKATVGEMREEAEHLKTLAAEEDDPHHSQIIWNYLHHHALELTGRAEDIFTPELTVDNPYYETNRRSEGIATFDGEDEIMNNLYDVLDDQVTLEMENNLFVEDNGLVSNSTEVIIEDGDKLQDAGFDIDDPDAIYERRFRSMQYWEYDDDAKLIGERIFQLGPYEIKKLAPSDIITLDDQIQVWKEYWPENTNSPPDW